MNTHFRKRIAKCLNFPRKRSGQILLQHDICDFNTYSSGPLAQKTLLLLPL